MKWIDIKDQLPDEGSDDVMVAVIGTFPDGKQFRTIAFDAWYDEGEWYYHSNSYYQDEDFEFDPQKELKVTHWMPYPDLNDLDKENFSLTVLRSLVSARFAFGILSKFKKQEEDD